MVNNIMIKNDSFIQSMHNDMQCIESINPNDKGTSRQYWFSASMLANIFDITDKTVRNNIDFLEKWGEVTMGKNLLIVKTQNSVGAVKDTTRRRVETLVNVGDLSVKNSLQIKIPDSNGHR